MKIAPLLQLREHGFLREYHYRHRYIYYCEHQQSNKRLTILGEIRVFNAFTKLPQFAGVEYLLLKSEFSLPR